MIFAKVDGYAYFSIMKQKVYGYHSYHHISL